MQVLSWLTAGCGFGVQVGEGIIYVAAGSSPGHFGTQLANALQVLEQLPNPLMLIYDYVLQFGGVRLILSWPTAYQDTVTASAQPGMFILTLEQTLRTSSGSAGDQSLPGCVCATNAH